MRQTGRKGLALNKLWGKIAKYDRSKDREVELIPLNEQGAEYILETPDGYPNAYFRAGNFKNKKAIKVVEEDGEGRIEKYDKNGDRIHKKYIDFNTEFIKIYPFEYADNKLQPLEYKYIFLNKLDEMCGSSVKEKEHFIKDEVILFQIKENFLEKPPECKNLIVTGMKNAGKTSLLIHLADTYFQEEEPELVKICVVEILERNIVKNNTLSEFKEIFEAKIENLKKSRKKRKILFIDDYDDNFDQFGDTFRDLLDMYRIETDPKEKVYFVLAGKRPRDFLNDSYAASLYEHFDELVLEGISEPPNTKNIDSILDEIGFQHDDMPNDLKVKAMDYASGLPYFYKSILYEMLKKWEDNFTLKLEEIDCWEEILKEVKKNYKEYFDTVANTYDKARKNTRTEVRFKEIINYISENGGRTGKVKTSSLKSHFINNKNDDGYQELKAKNLDIQLNLLIKFGLVRKDPEDYLIGIPYLFYYQGGKILEGK
jgi:hypothetical protein